MGNLRGWEWLIILLIVLLLFGAKKLPEAARGLGRSLKIFKSETKGLRDDDAPAEQPSTTTPTPPAEPRAVGQQAPPATPATPATPPASSDSVGETSQRES